MINFEKMFLSRYGVNSKKLILCISLLLGGIMLLTSSNKANTQDAKSVLNNGGYISASSDTEQKLCNILKKIQGVETADVMITYCDDSAQNSNYWGMGDKKSSKIQGVVVVAQGAEDAKVKSDIIYAVSVLLNVELCDIKVYPHNNK